MASLTTRINLTAEYAIAVEAAAIQQGVSQAEIVRMALRAYWGEDLSGAPTKATQILNGSPVHPVTRSPAHFPAPAPSTLPAGGSESLFAYPA